MEPLPARDRAGIRDQLGLRRAEAQGTMRPGLDCSGRSTHTDLDQVALAQDDQPTHYLNLGNNVFRNRIQASCLPLLCVLYLAYSKPLERRFRSGGLGLRQGHRARPSRRAGYRWGREIPAGASDSPTVFELRITVRHCP